MTDFALGLSFYEKTGSVFYYSMFSVFIILPEIVLSPVIGAFVDRYNKKNMMIIGHVGAGIGSVSILYLLLAGHQGVTPYICAVGLSSVCNAMVFVSFNVLVGEMLDRDTIPKFASFMQLGFALVFIASPSIAAVLLEYSSLKSVVMIDVVLFLTAVFVIAFTKISSQTNGIGKVNEACCRALMGGLLYLKSDPLRWSSLVMLAAVNFSMAIVSVLITPLVLSVASKTVLGAVVSVAGVGMLVGSVALMYFRTSRHLYWINTFVIFQSILLILALFNVDVILIGLGAFLYMGLTAMIGGLNYVYWQEKVDQDFKGRAFSARNAVMGMSIVLGYLLSGPLTQYVSKGILSTDWLLTGYVSRVFDGNPSPEISLMFGLIGGGLLSLVLLMRVNNLKL